jgi:methyl halide transferase
MNRPEDISNANSWSELYHSKSARWDHGTHHPYLEKIIHDIKGLSKKSVLSIGAGPAHDATYLDIHTSKTAALDFSEAALDAHRHYYPESKIEYYVSDFFANDAKISKHDLVFDHTFLCAIDPNRYETYFKRVKELLTPNGYYCAILFTDASKDGKGPPYSIPTEMVLDYLHGKFEIVKVGPVDMTFPGREGRETYLLARSLS